MSNATSTKPNKIKEPRVNCRVTPQLMKRLEKIATANGIDVSDVVRMALHRALPSYEAKRAA